MCLIGWPPQPPPEKRPKINNFLSIAGECDEDARWHPPGSTPPQQMQRQQQSMPASKPNDHRPRGRKDSQKATVLDKSNLSISLRSEMAEIEGSCSKWTDLYFKTPNYIQI